MGALIRAFDWGSTPLGPVERWPQRLRSAVSVLLPSKAQIVLFWGRDFITLYNDAYRPALGAKHPWALGKPARECWQEVWNVLDPLFTRVVATGEAFWAQDHPFRLERHGFPEETYFDVSCDPVRDESGNVGGVFCIVSETTGRVLGERRLGTLREIGAKTIQADSAATVLKHAADALALNPGDFPYACLYLVEGGERARLLGWTGADPAAGAEAIQLAGDTPAAAALRWARSSGEGAETAPAYWTARLPDSASPVRTLILPLTSGPTVVGFLVAGVSRFLALQGGYRDFIELVAARLSAAVTHAQALEEERRRAAALAELDRAKTLFFSNVSHEFRTPLTLILGQTEEALQAADGGLNGRALQSVHRNALRLEKLVNTLLDFSRIEAGRIEASYEPADLCALTRDLASVFRSAVEQAGLRFTVDCRSLDEPVYVDREMWEKIVFNLLSNAFKFTLEGEIAVVLEPGERGAVLTVRDTGTGIAPEELPRIFDRFHRVRARRARTQEGSGIGLALVQELVRLHGGSIDVESTPDAGTTFQVRIPYGTGHLPKERIQAARTQATTAIAPDAFLAEALQGGTALSAWLSDTSQAWMERDFETRAHGSIGARILIADDNADMRDYVAGLLAKRWSVEATADGAAALRAAQANAPDLILTDVMMPGLDGFALLRELRADPRTRHIPVIVLSARVGEEARIEGLEQGADDYLVKPFSARELVACVSAHLSLRRLREQAQRAERRLNEALLQERAVLGEVVTRAPAAIALVWGREHRFRLANQRYLNMAEGRGEIIGRTVAEVFPEAASTVVPWLDRVFETGGPFPGEDRPVPLHDDRALDGLRYFTFTYTAVPHRGATGGVLIVAVEKTEEVRRRRRLERELETERRIAETLQRSLLPRSLPELPGLEVASRYLPASDGLDVGGDWYDILPLADHTVAMVIGDVAGRGLGAAAVMGQLRSAVRAYAVEGLSPAEVAARLNQLLSEDGNLATAIFLVLDPDTGEIAYVNAGHVPPLLVGPDGVATFLEQGSPPLGGRLIAHQGWRNQIVPGSTLILYTDGLVDGSRDVEAGLKRLQQRAADGAARRPDELIDYILEDILPAGRPSDDVALLVLRLTALNPAHLAVTIPAVPASHRRLRQVLRRWLRASPVNEEDRFRILVASGEACANVVEHAYGSGEGRVSLEATRGADGIRIAIGDTGTWRPQAEGRRGSGGRGIVLMHELAEDVRRRSDSHGTTVELFFRVPAAAADGDPAGSTR